jgi:hypothetical protein
VAGARKDCIKMNFIICTLHQVLLELLKSRMLRWERHVAGMEEMIVLIVKRPGEKNTWNIQA